jgi:hypothetical protein
MMTTTTAKPAWMVAHDREIAKYKASPSGKATKALYDAATKAGGSFVADLRRAQVELVVETYNGETSVYATWERELSEDERFVFPAVAFARAEAWVRKYAKANGWTVA